MVIRQTTSLQEEKITALYERLSRDDDLTGIVIPSPIKKFSWRNTPDRKAMEIASTTRMTVIPEAILTGLHGSRCFRILRQVR